MDLAGARHDAKGTDVNDLEDQLTAMLHERAEQFASTDRLNEILAPSASKSPSTPHDPDELALTSSREMPIRRRLGATLLGVAAGLAVVVVGLAYIVGRDTDTGVSQTPVDTIRVDPTVAGPGDWISVLGEAGPTTATFYDTAWVRTVVELANGNIASAGDDAVVKIWDPANPEVTIATYTGHTDPVSGADPVSSVIQLANGNIASASADGVQIWDPANPEVTIGTYAGHTDPVSSVIQLANGNIASASADGVQIWDPANPEVTIATYTGHTDPVGSVMQLANGNIASTSLDDTVKIWDPANPEVTIATHTGYNDSEFVNWVKWGALELGNGNIASASTDGVQIWDPANPEVTIATYTGHNDTVLWAVGLANGNIASASADYTVQIWDPANPEVTIATYTGHTNMVLSMIQLANGNIASASADYTVQIWDPANP